MALPLVVLVTWVLDALLAGVYLKWLHPWRILLQEEPEQWAPEMYDKEGIEQANEQMEESQISFAAASATSHGQEDSPFLVRPQQREDMEVELHSFTLSNQVDAEIEVADENEKEPDSKEA